MNKKPNSNYHIGLRVGYLRRRDRLSQAELAKAVGLSRFQLSNIESGRVPLKLSTAWALSQLLAVHPNWIYWGGDDSQLFPVLPADDLKKLNQIYEANKDADFAETWSVLGVLLLEVEQKMQNDALTKDSPKSKTDDVKSELEKLIARVKRLAARPGAKAELARVLKVAPARVTEWLTDDQEKRKEPGGHYTLELLKWVEQQERQK